MAILVQHRETNVQYILIGTGYSYFKDSLPSPLGGVFFPDVTEGETHMVAVSDAHGIIKWLPSDEVRVIAVDGLSTSDILKGKNDAYDQSEKCPACGYPVNGRMEFCPSCELRLIDEEESY